MLSSNTITKRSTPDEIKVFALKHVSSKMEGPIIEELIQKKDVEAFKIHIDDPGRFLLFLKNVI